MKQFQIVLSVAFIVISFNSVSKSAPIESFQINFDKADLDDDDRAAPVPVPPSVSGPGSALSSARPGTHLRRLSFEERTKEFILTNRRRFESDQIKRVKRPQQDEPSLGVRDMADESRDSELDLSDLPWALPPIQTPRIMAKRDVSKDDVSDAVGKASDKVKDFAADASETAKDVGSTLSERGSQIATNAKDWLTSDDMARRLETSQKALESAQKDAAERLRQLRDQFTDQREKLAEQYKKVAETIGDSLKSARDSAGETSQSWTDRLKTMKDEAERKWKQLTEATDDDKLPPGVELVDKEEEGVWSSIVKRFGGK